jgi:hypothetical protein
MLETTKMLKPQTERGNVLFLILIAVALFAALSYAVTQSSRSGGGDANSETNLINSAQVTQYPSSVRTAIIRMMVSNSVDPASLEFNSPSDFSQCTGAPTTYSGCVFHPQGGGATFARGAADVASDGTPQEWIFNSSNEVALVGTTGGSDSPTATTADIIAFLPKVKKSVCEKINKELGLGGVTSEGTSIDLTTKMGAGTGYTSGIDAGGGTIGEGGAANLNGQAFGCFSDGVAAPNTGYTYYHVLIEQ